jgi:hypothetical protein
MKAGGRSDELLTGPFAALFAVPLGARPPDIFSQQYR